MIAGPHNDCINHLFQSMQFFADILVVEGVGLIGILKPGASALLFCADCVTREIYECVLRRRALMYLGSLLPDKDASLLSLSFRTEFV